MGLLVSCDHCSRAFVYSDRDEADATCPDCGTGPFYDWYTEWRVNDQ